MSQYVESRTRQAAVKVAIGKVATLPAGSQAYVKNVGTVDDMILEFGIPCGSQGLTGAPCSHPAPKDGVNGRDGLNGLSPEEIKSVTAKTAEQVSVEFKKAAAELKQAAIDEIRIIEAAADQAIADVRRKLQHAIDTL